MDPMATRYLDSLRHHPRPLPAAERAEATREIESHIAEGLVAGEPVAVILARLQPADTLARAYLADHYLQAPQRGWLAEAGQLVLTIGFGVGTGLTGLVVVPTLVIFTVVFGGMAIVTPILGVLHALGQTWIVITGLSGDPLPAEWSIPVCLALGLAFAVIAGLSLLGHRSLAPLVPRLPRGPVAC